MSKLYRRTIYTVSMLLLFALLGGPQMAYAWSSPQQAQQGKALLADSLPDAPSAQMQQQQNNQQANSGQAANPNDQQGTNPNTTQNKQQKANAPLGAAAAPAGVTAGGPASRPAGSALAPANQSQKRSLLIKLGLIAAGAAAIGTVYALSHATGSTPPGATH